MIVGEKASGGSSWSKDDEIAFERALAVYTDETDNRWDKIAGAVPGKTLEQVVEHYEKLLHDVMMIESGNIAFPDYGVPEETNVKERSTGERSIDRKCESKHEDEPKPKPNRRRAVPWTPLEHSKFLLGLEKYGKGDWRSISRHVILTRTPTQVASHAQKYFARLKSKTTSKQRNSIHDVNFEESSNISTRESPSTWQDAQAIQGTSQPSLDHRAYEIPTIWNTQATSQTSLDNPTYETPTIWNTQVTSKPSLDNPTYATPTIWNTQDTSQPSLDHLAFETPTIWNTQATSKPPLDPPTYATPTIWNTQATTQPSLDHSAYETPTIWNTQAISKPSLDHPTYATPTIWNTQATSESSLDHHVFGTPTIWNMQTASQPSRNVPVYGTSTIGQSRVGPMVLPYGNDMNLLAPPYMSYGVQHHSTPYSPIPSAQFNTGLVPDNMTYIPTSR